MQGTAVIFPCHLANIATGDQRVHAVGPMSMHESGHRMEAGGGCDGSEGEEPVSTARGAQDNVLKRVRIALLAGSVIGRGRAGDDNDVGDGSDARRGRRRLGLAGRGRMRPALTKWQGNHTECAPSPVFRVDLNNTEGVNGSGNDTSSPAGNINPYIRVDLAKDVISESDHAVQAELDGNGDNNA
ncbi:hypothetical protein D1007_06581 [Hordeum vulgare]|nr:hypothetical protein D1007_06581 [Hordeum vulgare]